MLPCHSVSENRHVKHLERYHHDVITMYKNCCNVAIASLTILMLCTDHAICFATDQWRDKLFATSGIPFVRAKTLSRAATQVRLNQRTGFTCNVTTCSHYLEITFQDRRLPLATTLLILEIHENGAKQRSRRVERS